MITQDEAQKLAKKVLGMSSFPECQVTITAQEQAYTRFANNGITTASFALRHTVTVVTTRDNRSGSYASNDLDEESLRKAALWDEVKDKLRQSGLGLSGGQQQRLCVARGIAVKPEVLLLDEPASALDPLSTRKLEETIVELKSDYTIVIVTHNLQQATRVSDNTAFMYLGRLIEFAPTTELFSAPKTKRTADYIGGRFG